MILYNRPTYRVAITGIGPITAVGSTKERFWGGLRGERSPVRRITRFDASRWKSQIAAEVDDFDAADYMDGKLAKHYDRFTQFAVASTRMALDDAGLEATTLDGDRVAVQMGSALGGAANGEAQLVNLLSGGVRAVDPRVALTTFCGAARDRKSVV